MFSRSLVLDYYFKEETIYCWPVVTGTTFTAPVIVAVVGIQMDTTDPWLSLTRLQHK